MAGQRWWSTSELCQSALSKAERDFAYPRMDIQMKALTSMIATLTILIGAKALAANQTCQDTDLKKRVAYYASNLPGGYYAKWNEVSCASSPGSEALVFSMSGANTRMDRSIKRSEPKRFLRTYARISTPGE